MSINDVYASIKVGALCGSGGLLLGGIVGTVRTRTPILFSLLSGVQCFSLGGVFWLARSSLLSLQGQNDETPSVKDRANASGIAGAISGGLNGAVIRGRGSIIPGLLVPGALAYAGDRFYQRTAMRTRLQPQDPDKEVTLAKGRWEALIASDWSPLKPISDEEYRDRLKEQLLQVDADIAILEEDIAALRAAEKVPSANNVKEATTDMGEL